MFLFHFLLFYVLQALDHLGAAGSLENLVLLVITLIFINFGSRLSVAARPSSAPRALVRSAKTELVHPRKVDLRKDSRRPTPCS